MPETVDDHPSCLPHDTQIGTGQRIGVLTSGGDAQGMNAAVRAVARTALVLGATPYAIHEGWQGAVDDSISRLHWSDVSSIVNQGGTVIGTARSQDFRTYEGRLTAAEHLLRRGIDRLIVIGGDGSLTGTDCFRSEWEQLVSDLLDAGRIDAECAAAHPTLSVVGLVGSIDNDLVGTDMTIGADSALHRIVDAIDALSSTAASHQRTFVVEVMGRHCGYLALMGAVAGGCDYVLTPEIPPEGDWEEEMCAALTRGRKAGRRESIVLVAEGAKSREGEPITSESVARVLKERLDVDARVTILGHVQRGGAPSAYDRWMPTLLGYAAVQEVLTRDPQAPATVLGVRHNRIARLDLVEAVEQTRSIAELIAEGRYDEAVAARGRSFTEMLRINAMLAEPPASHGRADSPPRIAILHAGGLAPGMNTAARAAVRLGIARGYDMVGVRGGFPGLIDGRLESLEWADVEGWAFMGGAELGTRRTEPSIEQYYSIGRSLENHQIDGLLIIGGINAYLAAHALVEERERYPAFRLPIALVPASIDNNLPGSELSIGADTAVNNAVWALDRIKESAAASKRCFVAEAMGRRCGYLAFMSGLAAGAELIYLHEDGMDLSRIAEDTEVMRAAFEAGRRLFLVVRNEEVSDLYTMDFMARAFEQEGAGLYDVRQSAIGHLQQGGSPSPFDRLLATRLVAHALDELCEQIDTGGSAATYTGMAANSLQSHPIERMLEHLDVENRRPRHQWWHSLAPVARVVSLPGQDCAEAIPVLESHPGDHAHRTDPLEDTP
ncbi:MAG: 6-phosphofructokinase [Bowdeniella nasicola]|nr:6-phosphofructokinase [Bowdeniella nasicola]